MCFTLALIRIMGQNLNALNTQQNNFSWISSPWMSPFLPPHLLVSLLWVGMGHKLLDWHLPKEITSKTAVAFSHVRLTVMTSSTDNTL